MENTLITLARFHYELGIIGYDEYKERIEVSLWLSDYGEISADPRLGGDEDIQDESREPNEDELDPEHVRSYTGKTGDKTDNRLEIVCLGLWVFTKADPDSYPSIPHGHYRNQNKPWPKLNPYTGRVFSSKHQENKSQRLSKKEMINIWKDENFKSFCREMIVWYQEQFPYFEFGVTRPLRMPKW
ncbi:hypothetical protein [Aeromonas hydrophila]|uniref:hypothetical protein n=1 Tax=Aeromonas hydrophila TaxID=644 RepID=UPI003EC7FD22